MNIKNWIFKENVMSEVTVLILGSVLIVLSYLNTILGIMVYFRTKRLKLKDDRIEELNKWVNMYQGLYHEYYDKYMNKLNEDVTVNKSIEKLKRLGED
jgi:hypothetical protein